MGLGSGDDVHPCFESGEGLRSCGFDEVLAARNRLDHDRSARGDQEVLDPGCGLPLIPPGNGGFLGPVARVQDNLLVGPSDARDANADPISVAEIGSAFGDELYEVSRHGTVSEQRDLDGSDQRS
jgi:hypothetical protein